MEAFKLASVHSAQGIRAAVVVGETVHELEGDVGGVAAGSVLALLERWDEAFAALSRAVDQGALKGRAYPLAEARFAAPILYPNKYLMAGANYADHAMEMQGKRPDKSKMIPFAFLKATRGCIIGPGEPIVKPATVEKLDWEGELGVVIGRPARNVSVADAHQYVAGYTICNDVTSRDRNSRTDVGFPHDWYAGKSCDTFGPMGPYFVPAQFVPEPENLALKTTVSGQVMQNSNTSFLLFNIAELIQYCTRDATLHPGDVISTGTPSGVGMGRGVFLKPGDTVVIEIEGLGRLENPVVAG